jgi:hypothetical protein
MATKVITALCMLSFPHLDKPQVSDNEDGSKTTKFSASLVFTPELLALPGEKERFEAMQAAALEAISAKWPGKTQQLLQSETFKKGFRRDAEAKGYPAGSIYVNCSSQQQPGFCYAYADPNSDPAKPKPLVIPADKIAAELYPGAIVRASVNAFAYDRKGNKGVSFGLNNVQKIRDGARLDSRKKAEDDFTVDLAAPVPDLANFVGR